MNTFDAFLFYVAMLSLLIAQRNAFRVGKFPSASRQLSFLTSSFPSGIPELYATGAHNSINNKMPRSSIVRLFGSQENFDEFDMDRRVRESKGWASEPLNSRDHRDMNRRLSTEETYFDGRKTTEYGRRSSSSNGYKRGGGGGERSSSSSYSPSSVTSSSSSSSWAQRGSKNDKRSTLNRMRGAGSGDSLGSGGAAAFDERSGSGSSGGLNCSPRVQQLQLQQQLFEASKLRGFLELNPYLCSGCGAAFQTKAEAEPGKSQSVSNACVCIFC
jgi:hypothetical protein